MSGEEITVLRKRALPERTITPAIPISWWNSIERQKSLLQRRSKKRNSLIKQFRFI